MESHHTANALRRMGAKVILRERQRSCTVRPAPCSVDSKKLEYGSRAICAGFPSSSGFGAGGQPHSNFLASTLVSALQQVKRDPRYLTADGRLCL